MKNSVIGLVIAGLAALLAGPALALATEITVHRSPWCGYCESWKKHLENNGFTVTSQDHEDMDPIKSELGMPADSPGMEKGGAKDS